MYINENSHQKIKDTHDLRLYELALTLFTKHPTQRTDNERETLAGLLGTMPAIKQAFGNSTGFKEVLAKCSDRFEYQHYVVGSPVTFRGQKSEEFIVILKGLINVYDIKPNEEILKQQSEWQGIMGSKPPLKKEKSKKTLQSVESREITYKNREETGTQTIKLVPSMSDESINLPLKGGLASVNEECTLITEDTKTGTYIDSLNSDKTEQGVSNNLYSIKATQKTLKVQTKRIPGKLSKTVAMHLSSICSEQKEQRLYDHLPEEEKLLLKDRILRKKFITQGACLVSFKGTMGPGDVINSECFQKECRSPYTLVAYEPTDVIAMSKKVYLEIFQEEHAVIQEKMEYFGKFFKEIQPSSLGTLINYITEKTYTINDKIYEQDDIANGLYFIKSGEVKCSTTLEQEDFKSNRPASTRDKEEKDTVLVPRELLNIPVRKEAVGTQWLNSKKPTKKIYTEEMDHSRSPSVRKHKAIVAMLGPGNSFGEEGLVTSSKRRDFTASVATARLYVYYLSSQYYSTIQLLCPKLVQILNEKAKNRNDWLEKRLGDMREVKGNHEELLREKSVDKKEFPFRLPIPHRKTSANDITRVNSKNQGEKADVNQYFLDYKPKNYQNKVFGLQRLYQESFMKAGRKMSSVFDSFKPERSREQKQSFSQEKSHGRSNSTILQVEEGPYSIRRPKKIRQDQKESQQSIGKLARSSYLEAFCQEITKKAQTYRETTIVPQVEDMLAGSFENRFEDFFKRNLTTGDEKSPSSAVPKKFVSVASPKRQSTPTTKKSLEEECKASLRSLHKKIASVPQLKTLIKRNKSVPAVNSGSYMQEGSKVLREEGIEGKNIMMHRQKRSESTQRLVNASEREIGNRSVLDMRREMSLGKKKDGEKESKKRMIISSKHSMFRMRPERPYLFTNRYKLPSPQVQDH